MAWPGASSRRRFAVLPFLVVAVAEPSPLWPAAHPGWLALLAALLTLEMVVRHQQRGRVFWLVAAGAAAALGFLFKQNVGAFAALGVAGYIALRPRDGAGGWLLTGVRVAFACAVAFAATFLLRPALDGTLAAMLLLPLLATLLLLLLATRSAADAPDAAVSGHWLRQMGAESALAGGAFVVVTLLWLAPLMLALGPEHTPLALFLGAVNQGALIVQLELPPRGARVAGLVAVWLPLVVAMLSQQPSQRAWRPGLAACVPVSALILWMPMQRPQPEIGPLANPWPAWLEAELGWMYVYLPAVGAWAALVALVWTRGRRALVSGPLPWYLLFGTLIALSLYPRIDPLHAMMAGPPLFVVGAWALARAHGVLTNGAGRVRKALVYLALLSLPIAASTPLVYWRFASLVLDNPLEPEPARYVPLGLERAPVLVLQRTATEIGGAVRYVREQTQPGRPAPGVPHVAHGQLPRGPSQSDTLLSLPPRSAHPRRHGGRHRQPGGRSASLRRLGPRRSAHLANRPEPRADRLHLALLRTSRELRFRAGPPTPRVLTLVPQTMRPAAA